MSLKKKDIVNKLISDFPQLKNDIAENLDEFPEIYLHLIFGDVVTPFFLEIFENPDKNIDLIMKMTDILEYMMKSDEEISEVVVCTVLERLSDEKDKLHTFSKFAGKETGKYIIFTCE